MAIYKVDSARHTIEVGLLNDLDKLFNAPFCMKVLDVGFVLLH